MTKGPTRYFEWGPSGTVEWNQRPPMIRPPGHMPTTVPTKTCSTTDTHRLTGETFHRVLVPLPAVGSAGLRHDSSFLWRVDSKLYDLLGSK